MKILVVGANGKIGRHIVRHLAEEENVTVKAMLRKQEQIEQFKHLDVETVIADLEAEDGVFKASQDVEPIIILSNY